MTRLGLREVDLKWVYLGCVIPDVPWILQRIVWFAAPGVDPHVLRAYAIVQASLFSCLVLSAAIALLSSQVGKTYVILGVNAILHLLLDALQTKWANGVHFLAPFSWEMTNWGLFWPESPISYVLTGLGLVYILGNWRRGLRGKPHIGPPSTKHAVGGGVLVAAYFVLPFLWLQGPVEANNHDLETLSTPQSRPGRYIELDRVRYVNARGDEVLRVWNAEQIRVEDLGLSSPATVSVRGVFVDERRIRVIDHHVHADGVRNNASYLGLILIAGVWLGSLRKTHGE